MNSSNWSRISDILDAVLDLPPDQRSAAADVRCGDDRDLRAAVATYLDADESHGVLDGPLILAGPSCVDAKPPDTLGRFVVREQIGSGGMGTVFRAEDPKLGRDVAIKLLNHATSPVAGRRFLKEARALAALNHPHIATIFEMSTSGGHPFIAMELVTGPTLAEVTRTPLGVERSLALSRQIASALEAAHSKGVVHRDLKPRNVVLTDTGDAKVLDFGLARQIEETTPEQPTPSPTGRDDHTGIGGVMGTPGYMSPEQVRGETAGFPSDVFALGCVMFECVVGRPTFSGPTRERLRAVLAGPADLSSFPTDAPTAFTDLVRACLSEAASDRPEATDVRRRLDETLDGLRRERVDATPQSGDDDPPHNLPRTSTSFVGRDDDLAALAECALDSRAVSIVGAGGCGKTRLAIEHATRALHQFPGGVHHVRLDPVTSPLEVEEAVRAVAAPGGSTEGAVATIAECIRDEHALIVLDNCEHVLDACRALVSALLSRCPNLRVLATTREALDIEGEAVIRLSPLSQDAACQLFVDRAAAADPTVSLNPSDKTVGDICRRLDAIPLALELAAARARVLDVRELAERLDNRFNLLTSASAQGEPHHRTLWALIDWSYERLTPEAQTMLRRLAVFSGTWSLEAAEAVATETDAARWAVLDIVTELLDKSLIERDVDESARCEQSRFRMLETIRAFSAVQHREFDDPAATHLALERHVARIARNVPKAFSGPKQEIWRARFDADHDTIVATLRSWVSLSDIVEVAVEFALVWSTRGQWELGRSILIELLKREPDSPPTVGRCRARNAIAVYSFNLCEYDVAEHHWSQSLTDGRTLKNDRATATALTNLSTLARRRNDLTTARTLLEEGLTHCPDDSPTRAGALDALASVLIKLGLGKEAVAAAEEQLAIQQAAGDERGEVIALEKLYAAFECVGRFGDAERLSTRALTLARKVGDPMLITRLLLDVSLQEGKAGRFDEAMSRVAEALEQSEAIGYREGVYFSHRFRGELWCLRGDGEKALAAFNIGAEFLPDPSQQSELDRYVAAAHLLNGDYREAAVHLVSAFQYLLDDVTRDVLASTLIHEIGGVLAAAGLHEEAMLCFAVGDAECTRRGFPLSRHPSDSAVVFGPASRAALSDDAIQQIETDADTIDYRAAIERSVAVLRTVSGPD